jgi:2-dehydropantoate 2-reductase
MEPTSAHNSAGADLFDENVSDPSARKSARPLRDNLMEFTPIEMQLPPEPGQNDLLTRRIHLLGQGSIGTFIAHSLKILPHPPPITIMMRDSGHYHRFKSGNSCIRLVDAANDITDEQFDFDLDLLQGDNANSAHSQWKRIQHRNKDTSQPLYPLRPGERMDTGETFIYTLIVSVKAQDTVRALSTVAHRLDSRSTICFMQNGLGQIDELNEKVFTNPEARPTYLLGIISHGCYMNGPNTVVHAGFGATSLGIYRDLDKYPMPPPTMTPHSPSLSDSERQKYYPTDEELYSSISSRYLLRTLTRSPALACAPYPYLDLLQLQLEKLVSNALLNPITAIYDVPNGATLTNKHISTVQNLLLAEISLVIRRLPELQTVPNVQQRFAAARLKQLYEAVATKTAKNSSSMREDMRKGRVGTEIDFINGYIVKRGEEVGIQCALNYMLVQMLRAKMEYSGEEKNLSGEMGSGTPYGTFSVGEVGDGKEDDGEPHVVLEDSGSKLKGDMY